MTGGEQLSTPFPFRQLFEARAVEYGYAGVPWHDDLVAGTETVENGTSPLPTTPGIGIEWDPVAARRHAIDA